MIALHPINRMKRHTFCGVDVECATDLCHHAPASQPRPSATFLSCLNGFTLRQKKEEKKKKNLVAVAFESSVNVFERVGELGLAHTEATCTRFSRAACLRIATAWAGASSTSILGSSQGLSQTRTRHSAC